MASCALLRWPCARLLWRARSRGDERKVTSHGSLLLHAQAWWDAQRFDQPVWQVAAWRDQKVRHIQLHVAKALGKVVAAVGEAARRHVQVQT